MQPPQAHLRLAVEAAEEATSGPCPCSLALVLADCHIQHAVAVCPLSDHQAVTCTSKEDSVTITGMLACLHLLGALEKEDAAGVLPEAEPELVGVPQRVDEWHRHAAGILELREVLRSSILRPSALMPSGRRCLCWRAEGLREALLASADQLALLLIKTSATGSFNSAS